MAVVSKISQHSTDNSAQRGELDFSVDFAFRHGVIDESLYNILTTECSRQSLTKISHLSTDFKANESYNCCKACFQFQVATGSILPNGGPSIFDYYNVYGISYETGWNLAARYMSRQDIQMALHVLGSPNVNDK